MSDYEILEVPPGSSIEEIKKSYHKLALCYHPDQNQNSLESTEKFKQINEAYTRLTSSKKSDNVESSLNEFFKNIFNPNFNVKRKREIKLELTLKEAFFGVKKLLQVYMEEQCVPCSECNHSGFRRTELPIEVNIPPRTPNGKIFLLRHKTVDVHIRIRILAETDYLLFNQDIIKPLKLNIFRIILSEDIDLEDDLLGKLTIPLSRINKESLTYSLINKGLGIGNFIIKIIPNYPTDLSPEQRSSLETLSMNMDSLDGN